eukprot:gnl/TRDRNA2_/TRDRNA2_166945_c2_seq1.p1 gnl/TRDRNA2_/TRDRNA2_166945_c2~~gnl/TRDRNA2_/TRDRNA2_166945_c2_seq1.p1  ORF type:complete len:792 (+),score=106.28 gnl/TRDRNA2_/TRDRNA2_166945_c2_seq1:66-2378(+)
MSEEAADEMSEEATTASVATEEIASGLMESWLIFPRLQEVDVRLVGSKQAAVSQSSLVLTFVPVSNANVLWLVAEYPREVNFDLVMVGPPKIRDEGSTKLNNLVVLNVQAVKGIKCKVDLFQVLLGRGGGQTVFSLSTYKDAELTRKVDQRMHFPGYFQAGRVSLEAMLEGIYATMPEAYPARNKLLARSGEESRTTLSLAFTFPVTFGDRIVLSAMGGGAYTVLVDERFSLTRLAHGESPELLLPTSVESHSATRIAAELLGEAGSIAVDSGLLAKLIFWVVPTLGTNNWRIDTYRDNVLTNTNDGVSTAFEPVAKLGLLIQAIRSPPGTTVEMQLQVSNLETEDLPLTPELVVVAPPGFGFPTICGDLCTSRGPTYEDTGRAVATLLSLTTTSLLEQELKFLVTTPERTPTDLLWIVKANGLAGQEVAWGADIGFKINQMRDTQVLYGGIQGLRGAMVAFTFMLTIEAEDRFFTVIEVNAPQSFVMSCRAGNLFPLSLPDSQPLCERDGPGQLRLSLNQTLTAGEYAFAARANLPVKLPDDNVFGVVIRERASEVIIDASFDISGQPLVGLSLSQPSLAWSTAGFRELTTVTIGFTFSNATDLLRAFLITLPSGYKHSARTVNDVKSSNAKLPLLRGGLDWVDTSSDDRLRIFLEESDPLIYPDSYRIIFPVLMPESPQYIPRVNLWRLGLCSDRYCMDPNGPSVLASFPMPGFVPGEESYLENRRKEFMLAARQSADEATRASSLQAIVFALLTAGASMWPVSRCST